MSISNFTSRPSGFAPVGPYGEQPVQKDAAADEGAPRPDGRGESELNLTGRVQHTDGDAVTQDLVRRLTQIIKRVMAPAQGKSLTREEKIALRNQIVASMGADADGPTGQAIRELASLFAGLTDELDGKAAGGEKFVTKAEGTMATVRCARCQRLNTLPVNRADGIEELTCEFCKQTWRHDHSKALSKSAPASAQMSRIIQQIAEITSIIEQRWGKPKVTKSAPAGPKQFVAKGHADPNDTKIQKMLDKALANGRRVDAATGDVTKGGVFKTAQSVAPGVRFRSDGTPVTSERLDGTDESLGKALSNPQRF